MSTNTITSNSLNDLDWSHLVKPSLTIDHASVFFNTFWGADKEPKVTCVINLVPRYADPIQKSIVGKTAQEVMDEAKYFLQSL